MKLTLFSHDAFNTIILPKKCAGQYWVCAKNAAGVSTQIVAAEGIRPTGDQTEGQWILKSNSRYQIIDRNRQVVSKLPLELLSVYMIRSTDGKSEFRLYTEPLSEDRKRYRVYEIMSGNISLEIGRSPDCAIRYASGYIGKNHATLLISGTQMMVTDNDSLNRTFVNGTAIQQALLKPGDVIYMMGMQIIVSKRFLYINDPDGKVSVQSRWLREFRMPEFQMDAFRNDETPDTEEFDDYYYRAPRFKHDVEPFKLKLDAPPSGQSGDNTPMLMSIGPSITMGMASATTAAFSVINAASSGNIGSAIPSIVMSLGMLSGTLLWPTLTKSYQKKENKKKETARQAAYKAYLQQMEQRVAKEIAQQEQILRENDGSTDTYLRKATSMPLQIWERTPKHSDFLRLRLGYGQLPMNANIIYPERRFAVEQDNLTEAMLSFGEKERLLKDVPICLPLTERFVSGFYANHNQLLNYAKSLILQLTVLHSYDEVKLVILYDKRDEDELSFVRWLPHTMDNEQRVRYIATTSDEAKNLSADLEPIIDYRKALNADQLEDESPYFVVLCLDKKLASRAECIRTLLENKENIRFSVVSMYERLKDLPKECSAVVELDSYSGGALTLINDVSVPPIPFSVDIPRDLDMRRVTEVLSNTLLDVNNSAFQLPRKYTFLEMMDVGMVDHLNLVENWAANDPTRSLAAPIGIDAYGEPLCLDIHERAHGPHGLIAGMTGSGKSETIISYILSLAIHYHPNEVAFILIDYKGGGMAKAFENIPHTAGIITNLDGNAINRSLVSMQSELHRRELIFQKVSKQHNVSNIDIYKYQKLYREGKVSKPLPHLVIISDEFAELKKDQPEFMAALTSTARVGRSLGVHLILATQKPGGVVDDQIRSNSRFRLCLKVQDRGDSTEMMGRPEAASLVDTGRFYLQVGNNELFEMGQSAWAGAPYHPSATVIKELDDAISVIDTNGHVIAEVNTNRYAGAKDAPKQLDAITEYIRKVSDEEQITRWKMWLDPIPAKIYVDKVAEKYSEESHHSFVLNPIVGELDDPIHQDQKILRVPLSDEGNVVVYGSTGSGKGMFLEAMCYSLMREHTPDEVNLYILDFGSETMTAFAGAPHVGDVILSHETEKVDNLFKLMLGKLISRKKLLSQFGETLEQYNVRAVVKEPNIVVMINNFANFTEMFENRLGDLTYLTREGIRYGIYFVLSCTGVNNLGFRLQQNFKNLYCLQMNNSADYSTVVGKTGGLVPDKFIGRGLLRAGKDSVLEFQTAHIVADESPYAFIRAFCKDLSSRYTNQHAAGVPVLPEVVSVNFLVRHATPKDLCNVPVGVEKETLEIARINFTSTPIHLVLSHKQEWRPFTSGLATLLAQHYNIQTILLAPETTSGSYPNCDNLSIYTDRSSCAKAVSDIFQQVLVRNNTYKTALENGTPVPHFEPLFVIIQSMAQLKTLLGGQTVENARADDDTLINRLQLAMQKCTNDYQVYFIVAENVQGQHPSRSEEWYRTHVNSNNGIWLGNGFGANYILNANKKSLLSNVSLESNFGFLVRDAEATLVKFLQ